MCVHAQWVSLQRPLRTEHVKSSQVKSSQVKSNSRRSRIRLLWVARRRESGGRGAAQLAWLDSPEPGGLIIHSHVFMHGHVHIVFRSLNRLIIVVFYSSSSFVIQLATSRRPEPPILSICIHMPFFRKSTVWQCTPMQPLNATPQSRPTMGGGGLRHFARGLFRKLLNGAEQWLSRGSGPRRARLLQTLYIASAGATPLPNSSTMR